MEARRLKMEQWRVFRAVIADPDHFDEEQDAGPDLIRSESWIRIRIKVKSWIRIRIKEKGGTGSALK